MPAISPECNKVAGARTNSSKGKVKNMEYLKETDFTEPTILIRVNDEEKDPFKLYERTRAAWGVNLARAEKCKYALCAYQGCVLEVYTIAGWFVAGSTMMSDHVEKDNDKYEFVGNVAAKTVREKFVGKSVRNLRGTRGQNPTLYFGEK